MDETPWGRRAHRVAVASLVVAVAATALGGLFAPGAPAVVWPVASYRLQTLAVGGLAALVCVVTSSVAAYGGYPRWGGPTALGVLFVLFCAGCCGFDTALSLGGFDPGGERVGNTTWRTARVPMDSYTVGALYRCDRFGIVCTRCPDAWGDVVSGPFVAFGTPPTPRGEECPAAPSGR